MRQIDFEHGGIAQNILKAALPMLVAQVLNLLYNIVDRIYIARIPDIGTAARGAGFASPLLSLLRRSAICSAAAAHRCSPSPAAAGIRPVPG